MLLRIPALGDPFGNDRLLGRALPRHRCSVGVSARCGRVCSCALCIDVKLGRHGRPLPRRCAHCPACAHVYPSPRPLQASVAVSTRCSMSMPLVRRRRSTISGARWLSTMKSCDVMYAAHQAAARCLLCPTAMAETCPVESREVFDGIPAMPLACDWQTAMPTGHRDKASHRWFPFNASVARPVIAKNSPLLWHNPP